MIKRFSQIYLERGKPTSDSGRFRRRIRALAEHLFVPFRHSYGTTYPADDFYEQIRIISGPDMKFINSASYSLYNFLECGELRDVLDAVTVGYAVLRKGNLHGRASDWKSGISKVISEENLGYKLDEECVVHVFIDEEFERNRTSALIVLDKPDLGEARQDYEDALRHLRGGDMKQSLIMNFRAVETTTKVLFPGSISRLGPSEVRRIISRVIEQKYSTNEPAISAGKLMLESFCDWINAVQVYRHGQEVSQPADPPSDFSVLHFSIGTSFLRWLVELCGAED